MLFSTASSPRWDELHFTSLPIAISSSSYTPLYSHSPHLSSDRTHSRGLMLLETAHFLRETCKINQTREKVNSIIIIIGYFLKHLLNIVTQRKINTARDMRFVEMLYNQCNSILKNVK
jgi:hypothetical protein